MGLFRWIFGARSRGVVAGDGEFEFRVVGSLHHQSALESICGNHKREGEHRYCAALLTPQPSNRHDRHAIAVTIRGIEVGFLDREDARDFGQILRRGGFADAPAKRKSSAGGIAAVTTRATMASASMPAIPGLFCSGVGAAQWCIIARWRLAVAGQPVLNAQRRIAWNATRRHFPPDARGHRMSAQLIAPELQNFDFALRRFHSLWRA